MGHLHYRTAATGPAHWTELCKTNGVHGITVQEIEIGQQTRSELRGSTNSSLVPRALETNPAVTWGNDIPTQSPSPILRIAASKAALYGIRKNPGTELCVLAIETSLPTSPLTWKKVEGLHYDIISMAADHEHLYFATRNGRILRRDAVNKPSPTTDIGHGANMRALAVAGEHLFGVTWKELNHPKGEGKLVHRNKNVYDQGWTDDEPTTFGRSMTSDGTNLWLITQARVIQPSPDKPSGPDHPKP